VELVAAFRLYCELPFGRLHHRNPEIVALAKVLDRTPSSVAMKLVNLASLDPAITASGRKGLGNASAGDRQIWREFRGDWTAMEEESGEVFHRLGIPEAEAATGPGLLPPTGETSAEALVQVRRGQAFFRRAVLASYGGQCCMSGLAEPGLLLASHIKPWARDAGNRLNPSNGLCLSALHDRAFDQGLIGVDTDYHVRVSPVLRDQGGNALAKTWLLGLEGTRIRLPERFLPEREFLAWHMGTLFQAG
jgi:DNA (cytosine-5)-methyltransferase 1/putative restriction endonuclease